LQFTLYEWVYIISSIFGAYTIYKFMKVFFDIRIKSKSFEFVTYIIYYIFSICIYLIVNIPIVLMISNLAAFIALTYNYESTIRKRVLSALQIYLALMAVELIVGLISGYFDFPVYATNNYCSAYGMIAVRILSYVVVLILQNFKNIKKGESVLGSNWLCIVLIPFSSLYFILLLFQAKGLSLSQVLIGIILAFLINFASFYLYDAITAALSEKMQSLLAIEQNQYYDKQLKIMNSSLKATRILRHDLRNHMFSIRSLIEKDGKEEALNYISSIMENMGANQDYVNSGNTIIDSILNFKYHEAKQNGIKIGMDLSIPEELEIPSFDLTIILGNLLDNAIESVLKVKEGGFVNIKIKYDRNRLIILIDNPYCTQVIEENGRILTTKENKDNHGIGLLSVQKVIEKYKGTMSVDYSGKIFSVSIIMFLES
jgi:two-component system sensor histidine kinase AgrC